MMAARLAGISLVAFASRAAAQSTGAEPAGPSTPLTTFAIVAFAVTAFVISFVVAQRTRGKSPPEIDETVRSIKALDTVSRDVESLRADLSSANAPPDVIRDLDEAERTLDDVALDLRRAVEKTA